MVTLALVVLVGANVFPHRGYQTPPFPFQHLSALLAGSPLLSFSIHYNSLDRGEVAIGMHRQHRQIHHPEYHWEIIPFLLHAAGIRLP